MMAAMSGSTSDRGPSYCSSSFLVPAKCDIPQKMQLPKVSLLYDYCC
jgi:hypothetical protein